MNDDLRGKVALVTGGSTGIGRAVALHLAKSGAHVLITGRHEETLRESASRHKNIGYLVADVAASSGAAHLIEEVERLHGRLDILVNNAGVAPAAPLRGAIREHVREVFDVNVIGLIETTRQVLPLLLKSKGAIVNVASVAADQPAANLSVYSASKAAVVALTRAWAQELSTDGVRVNAVSPGPIETPIYGKMGLPKEQLDQMAAGMLQLVPMKRFGRPEEVAAVVGFLCAPGASYVTGAQYTVGGGSEA